VAIVLVTDVLVYVLTYLSNVRRWRRHAVEVAISVRQAAATAAAAVN
jgi:hypothetical protein